MISVFRLRFWYRLRLKRGLLLKPPILPAFFAIDRCLPMKPFPESSAEPLRQTAKILQAVTATMSMGAIIGLIVVVGLVPQALNNDPNMLVILGAFTAMVSYGLSYVVASILNQPISSVAKHETSDSQNEPGQGEETDQEDQEDRATKKHIQRITSRITNSHIIRSAIIEAAVFLNLMVLLLERNYISVTVILLGVMLLIALLPSYGRLRKTIQKQLAS